MITWFPLTDERSDLLGFRRSVVMNSPRVPDNQIAWIGADLDDFTTGLLEPIDFLCFEREIILDTPSSAGTVL